MADIKFAYNSLVYVGEPISEGIKRCGRYGYDGIEIVGEPGKMDSQEILSVLEQYSIKASSVLGIYNTERNLVSGDSDVQNNALRYVKDCIEFAEKLGAPVVTVQVTPCMKIRPDESTEVEWARAVKNLRELGIFAAEKGVALALEAWNRYETYLVNRLEQAVVMVKEVDLNNVGCMCDTFHMNIEEKDMLGAIRESGGYLKHVHFADNTRRAPGYGALDFKPIIQSLLDMDYTGYISMELLPPAGDPFLVLENSRQEEFYDEYTENSIKFLKDTLNELL